MKYFLLIALGFIIGCAGTQSFPVTIQVDENFTSLEIQTIDRSFQQWADSTGIVSYDIKTGFPHAFDMDTDYHRDDGLKVMYKFSNEEWDRYCDEEEFCDALGVTARNAVSAEATTMIFKYQSLESIDFHKAILHEIGHFLGIIDHSLNSNSLMYSSLRTSEGLPAGRECVDEESLQMFCSLYDCNVARGACQVERP